ncbi:MAG: AAA family ATPase [Armatimonadetes bacterium]|nr:AAA family ATPase [Armatimonadota bacterium]
MLSYLDIKDVGPASRMRMELSSRINIITGDNGLGKSFLLDVAWWALTRTWARGKVLPHQPPSEPSLGYGFDGKSELINRTSKFDRRTQEWKILQSRPAIPGIVLYAQVDGGFSVWDPARNYWQKEMPNRPAAYLFSSQEIWEGNEHCEGLIRDWASWQREESDAYEQFKRVLSQLSPSSNELLVPGELRKISIDDPKRYPTIRMPYGEEVPIIHASAGMRRVIALAYLLVWTWQEHWVNIAMRQESPAKEIIFLIDEVEGHLHPQWQRRIVPALLDVMDALTGSHEVSVQLITATHSPLVLASVESRFDKEKDSWFDLNFNGETREVTLEKRAFYRQGDISDWLTSEAFDLKQARSLEAEVALTEALALLRVESPAIGDIERVDTLLRNSLSGIDRFWARWSEFRKRQEVG